MYSTTNLKGIQAPTDTTTAGGENRKDARNRLLNTRSLVKRVSTEKELLSLLLPAWWLCPSASSLPLVLIYDGDVAWFTRVTRAICLSALCPAYTMRYDHGQIEAEQSCYNLLEEAGIAGELEESAWRPYRKSLTQIPRRRKHPDKRNDAMNLSISSSSVRLTRSL